ncbi:MAG: FkbM family methyltransferase [Verrucomicrobiota bacterium]
MKNWPTVIVEQYFTHPSGVRQLCFRDGLKAAYRPETQDWETVKEVMLDGVYAVSLDHLKNQPGHLPVLDLGANIGLFSLRAAQCKPGLEVHAYEPAPQNIALMESNQRVNPELAKRIHIHSEAVGGFTRTARFFFDEKIPQASSLFSTGNQGQEVTVRAFAEIVTGIPVSWGLVKIDVEGAEYEIFKHTPPAIWEKVLTISIEIHADPEGRMQKRDLLKQIESLGYTAVKEFSGHSSYFFHRNAPLPAGI